MVDDEDISNKRDYIYWAESYKKEIKGFRSYGERVWDDKIFYPECWYGYSTLER